MDTFESLRILGISGSLRRGSFNTALLRAAAEMLPSTMALEIIDLSPLPIFNADTETPFPEPVSELRARIAEADGLLIATPEYNGSLSGALKNALDWASRAPKQPLSGKPVAIVGASTGAFGTVRSQTTLRQVLTHLGALSLGKPEVLVARAEQAFDAELRLVDAAARRYLGDLLVAFEAWIRRVSHR